MIVEAGKCLYDDWRASSAPMYNNNGFWPVFIESDIKAFIEGKTAQPVASRDLDTAKAVATKQHITKFLGELSTRSEADYPCKSAYIAFERGRLTFLELVLNVQDPAQRAACNDEMYGKLADIYQPEALQYLKYYVEQLKPRSAAVAKYRTQLLDFWKDVPADDSITQRFAAFEQYRLNIRPLVNQRFAFLEELLAPYQHQPSLDSEEVCKVLQEALGQVLGERGVKWRAVVRVGAPNVFISYDLPAIVVPASRKFTPDQVWALAVHEIGAHVTRSVNGASSRERLAGLGMAGYGPAEEALGALMGNSAKKQHSRFNDLMPFAVLDFAGRPAAPTFRDVYELTKALWVCVANPDDTTLPTKDYDYGRAAFTRTIRMLRLGTGTVIERANTKYWRGLLLLSKYFEENGLTEASLEQFFVGKYDCLNKTQLKLIMEHSPTY